MSCIPGITSTRSFTDTSATFLRLGDAGPRPLRGLRPAPPRQRKTGHSARIGQRAAPTCAYTPGMPLAVPLCQRLATLSCATCATGAGRQLPPGELPPGRGQLPATWVPSLTWTWWFACDVHLHAHGPLVHTHTREAVSMRNRLNIREGNAGPALPTAPRTSTKHAVFTRTQIPKQRGHGSAVGCSVGGRRRSHARARRFGTDSRRPACGCRWVGCRQCGRMCAQAAPRTPRCRTASTPRPLSASLACSSCWTCSWPFEGSKRDPGGAGGRRGAVFVRVRGGRFSSRASGGRWRGRRGGDHRAGGDPDRGAAEGDGEGDGRARRAQRRRRCRARTTEAHPGEGRRSGRWTPRSQRETNGDMPPQWFAAEHRRCRRPQRRPGEGGGFASPARGTICASVCQILVAQGALSGAALGAP